MVEKMKLYPQTENKLEGKRKELNLAVQKISHAVNEELGITLLSDDGTVSMKHYGFDKDVLEQDKILNKNFEDDRISEQYLVGKDQITPEMRKKWTDAKESAKSVSMELLVMVLMHKVLKDEYIVARGSKYDDYHNKVDTLIVHKASGTVVCAFDDVHSRQGGEREQYKIDRLIKSAQKGGSHIKYGFTFENSEMIKKQMHNIPKFYMAMTMDELDDALNIVDLENLDSVSNQELLLFSSMMEFMSNQIDTLRVNSSNKDFQKNLEDFAALSPSLRMAA